MRAAQKVGVPVAATEQYPKGLGHLAERCATLLPEAAIGDQECTSPASRRGACRACPAPTAPQVVVAGIEAHVCVLQTALELVEEGKEVYVVADAVGSRRARSTATWRWRGCAQEGVRIVSREMVVFEWLGEAGTPLFRDISREFLR